VLDEILEAESWTYQEILQKGYQIGYPIGYQIGLELAWDLERQKWLEQDRHIIIKLLQRFFPELVSLAQSHVDTINDSKVMQALLNQLIAAQTAEEARQAIMNARVEE
jgi:hypothetical protein